VLLDQQAGALLQHCFRDSAVARGDHRHAHGHFLEDCVWNPFDLVVLGNEDIRLKAPVGVSETTRELVHGNRTVEMDRTAQSRPAGHRDHLIAKAHIFGEKALAEEMQRRAGNIPRKFRKATHCHRVPLRPPEAARHHDFRRTRPIPRRRRHEAIEVET